ncbi:hypothetical protein V8G54_002879 [Vigna mungo]|uniref:Uncharacterized protein n=1 Tax=Vigna mungo TaxID=3915 RepID=A0AAQ3PBW2_VIGMU
MAFKEKGLVLAVLLVFFSMAKTSITTLWSWRVAQYSNLPARNGGSGSQFSQPIIGHVSHRNQPLRYPTHYTLVLFEVAYMQPSSPAWLKATKLQGLPSFISGVCLTWFILPLTTNGGNDGAPMIDRENLSEKDKIAEAVEVGLATDCDNTTDGKKVQSVQHEKRELEPIRGGIRGGIHQNADTRGRFRNAKVCGEKTKMLKTMTIATMAALEGHTGERKLWREDDWRRRPKTVAGDGGWRRWPETVSGGGERPETVPEAVAGDGQRRRMMTDGDRGCRRPWRPAAGRQRRQWLKNQRTLL